MPSLASLRFPADAKVSIWCGPLEGPATFAVADAVEHYAASTVKIALVLTAHREAAAGRLDLDEQIAIHHDFRSAYDGSAFTMQREYDEDPAPWDRTEATWRWLCQRAIVRSSNLATNLLLERVGADAVAETLKACGATGTRMTRGIEDVVARDQGLQNLVTARDLALTLQALASGEVASAAATAEILASLEAQELNEMIPAGLPPDTRIAHKTGSVDGIAHDAAIITPPDGSPYILVVCTTDAGTEDEASGLIADVAAASWREQTT